MDLHKFLKSKARYQDFQWDATFYSALTGLASALSKTHCLDLTQPDHGVSFKAIGYHHDLRPPNVLVSHDSFILADFGLGHLKPAESLSHTPYKSNSGDYIAPECTDMEEKLQSVSRPIDVWAFGCLILEVVTYLLRGVDGVEEFRTRRLTNARLPGWKDASFYRSDGDVKEEVCGWIERLRCSNPRSDSVTRLLDLSLQALSKEPQSRPSMPIIHHRLVVLSLQKCYQRVQDLFRRVRGNGETTEHYTQP